MSSSYITLIEVTENGLSITATEKYPAKADDIGITTEQEMTTTEEAPEITTTEKEVMTTDEDNEIVTTQSDTEGIYMDIY